jgi:hypothetical protein
MWSILIVGLLVRVTKLYINVQYKKHKIINMFRYTLCRLYRLNRMLLYAMAKLQERVLQVFRKETYLISVVRIDKVTKVCATDAHQHSCNLIEFLHAGQVAVAVLCCRTVGQSKCLTLLKMKNMSTCISYTVSAAETVGLLLWNTGNFSHTAESHISKLLELRTECWGRLVTYHGWRQNANNSGFGKVTF